MQGSDGGLGGETRQLAAVLREAGAIALKTFQTPLRTWLKNGSSPVSEADIAVDGFLREQLAGPGSGCGWLSEETADDRSSATNSSSLTGANTPVRTGRPSTTSAAEIAQSGRPAR